MRKIRIFNTGLWLLVLSAMLLFGCRVPEASPRTTVKIAVPYEGYLELSEREEYKAWLEKESGLDIEFSMIPEHYTRDYLNVLFSVGDSDIDAVFFTDESFVEASELEEYGSQGMLAPLEPMIDQYKGELFQILEHFKDYNLRRVLEANQGHIYYMPSLDTSRAGSHSQILWINVTWLEALKLPIPRDVESFASTMEAFAAAYPQGVPIIGSMEEMDTDVCRFLMNSFEICDGANGYMAMKEGQVYYAPMTENWRSGLSYLRRLYQSGVLAEKDFSFTKEQLTALVNDPRNLTGSFSSKFITGVLSENSSELFSRYLPVTPLAGPLGNETAVVETKLPRPGGVILATSKHRKELFFLMDLMCGEAAYLKGHYGQKGLDWEDASVSDISVYGEPASITVTNRAWYKKSKGGYVTPGPYVARAEYADGISWKGYQVNQGEYMDARAYRLYEPFCEEERLKVIIFHDEEKHWETVLDTCYAYSSRWMKNFITGVYDVENQEIWDDYLQGLRALEVEKLTGVVQKIYEEMEEGE